ncbi:VPLPA-CTERM sorting domain-containing protein [Gymnodinialimonas ulvae]|uniref:VPLPA-CTERM sorting domain-containing protein n=1 Tax=Gymnodinialimonas ulvae TaxID=3126504 RepID=UPI0030A5D816
MALLPIAASATVIDFDQGQATYSAPNALDTYSQDGFTFSFTQSGRNSEFANLYDTTNPNPDWDLVPDVQGENGVGGLALIRQNSATPNLTNDAPGNGSIFMTLDAGNAFRLIGFSAIDDGDFSLFVDGSEIASLSPGEDRATAQVSFAPTPLINVGDTVEFRYRGSGAIDALAIAPVPLPAGAVLLLSGLGGLAFMRRRRRMA